MGQFVQENTPFTPGHMLNSIQVDIVIDYYLCDFLKIKVYIVTCKKEINKDDKFVYWPLSRRYIIPTSIKRR